MTKIVFAAVLFAACYSAYKAFARAAERQRENLAYARARQGRVEPRDLGTLRETDEGFYVPENRR
ncbi:MAG: hypothetical protein ACOH12_16270 [Parvibaculaceae bacterium]